MTNQVTTLKIQKNDIDLIENINSNLKTHFIDSVVYHTDNIDLDCFQKTSLNDMFRNYIISDEFIKLNKEQRRIFFDNYHNLNELFNTINLFKKDNDLYEYQK